MGGIGLNALNEPDANRQKKVQELEQVQSDIAALDAFRASQNAALPAVAMDAIAPRAPSVQGAAAQGVQAAMNASQTGIDFRQIGSEIVAAVNAGTEVSRSMLGVLTKIADKKTTELAFQ